MLCSPSSYSHSWSSSLDFEGFEFSSVFPTRRWRGTVKRLWICQTCLGEFVCPPLCFFLLLFLFFFVLFWATSGLPFLQKILLQWVISSAILILWLYATGGLECSGRKESQEFFLTSVFCVIVNLEACDWVLLCVAVHKTCPLAVSPDHLRKFGLVWWSHQQFP